VYTETNNPADGQNAVLAFRRDGRTGDLTQIGKYATGGTGPLNVPKAVGIDDGDQQVQATADGKFLFAVNQGSDSVTAFRIGGQGRLTRVGVYASGGDQPDTVGIAGNFLDIGNAGDAAAGHPGTTAPSVRAFTINRDGSLTAMANSTVTFPVGTRVTQTLVSHDARFLFVEAASFQGTAGATLLFVYPGPAEKLKARAGEFVKGKDYPAHVQFLLDPDSAVTTAYHLRWDAKNETGYPSAFVLDGKRKVTFAKVSKTHGDRAPVADVLKAVGGK